MGKTKNYLRYIHDATFGVVAASQVGASIKFLEMRETKDRFVAVPANECVIFWDLKTKQIVNKLRYDEDNAAEVTTIDCHHGGHPRTNLIAVGYANGKLRVFEYETGELKTTFTGHRTSISALRFDRDGTRLASGGKDCNIVVWDVLGEKGLFSLKGHKNSISKLEFLFNEEHQKDLVVSSSIDSVSTIKFWDLQTQHCFCTLPDQSNGVWSFKIFKNGTRMITGSASPELKVYSIEFMSESIFKRDDDSDGLDLGLTECSENEYGMRVKLIGSLLRNTTSVTSRVQDIIIDKSERVVLCHSTDKNMEMYLIRSKDEALKYARKQAKKEARRDVKRKRDLMDGDESNDVTSEEAQLERTTLIPNLDVLENQARVDCEFNRKLGCHKLSDKIKAIDITQFSGRQANGKLKIGVMLASNKLETCLLDPQNDDREKVLVESEKIDSLSHRTDVRDIAFSPDCSLILSTSAESAKIWRSETRSCIATIDIDHASCCIFADAQNLAGGQENRYALIGTKHGQLQLIDLREAIVVQSYEVSDKSKSVTSMCVLPDKTGIVLGCEDGTLRFYNYIWTFEKSEAGTSKSKLTIEQDRTLQFQEGITDVKVSPNGKLVAVALLDSTVRVHFLDTFKYFLTMYGHKFPVTCMDISDDNTLLVTGSPDKNLKIWGLDFGDCHKSIFAHDDIITCVKFLPKTHFVFSCGRDRLIKQWDCDHFIRIQMLRGHQGEIWCLDISQNGKLLVTGSHDRSIRLFRKTEEILIPSEEEEVERELDDERNVYEKQENVILGETNLETGFAAKMTIETVKSTDRLIEAIDVYNNEKEKEIDHKIMCEQAAKAGEPEPAAPERDPLLMVAMTTDYRRYMLEILRQMKSSEIEEILLTLPFDYVRKLLNIIVELLEKKWEIELLTRCAIFLLKVNYGQIAACPSLVPAITKLKVEIREGTYSLRDSAYYNMTAMEHLLQNRKYMETSSNRKNISIDLY